MKTKTEYSRNPNPRVYDIEFKDGTIKSIIGHDVPIQSLGLICSISNHNLLSDRFLAIRAIDKQKNILIAIDSIKYINISEYKKEDSFVEANITSEQARRLPPGFEQFVHVIS